MLKRVLFGTGATGVVAAAYLLGSVTLSGAFAQAPTPNSTQPPAPTQAGPTQAAPTQAGPTQAGPTQAGPTQAGPTQAGPTQAGPQDPSYQCSTHVPQDQNDQSDTNEGAALQSLAKITADQAKAAALAGYPGGTATKVELDSENGCLVYSVHVTDANGKAWDVKVDAGDGKVLHTEADGPEGAEGADGADGPDGAESGN